MFESNSTTNWQILGNTVSVLVAEVLSAILDPRTPGAPLQVSAATCEQLLLQATIYCNKVQIEGEPNFDTIDMLNEQVTSIWSSQVFAKLSRVNFDLCLQFFQNVITKIKPMS